MKVFFLLEFEANPVLREIYQKMAATLADLVALRELSPNVYETLLNPEKMGNPANIAYGGCTIAAAAKAAHQNLPDKYRLYSLTGHYLGPALSDRKLICSVRDVRKTRTFVTRQIEVSQEQEGQQGRRVCMVVVADFQVPEPASLFVYSKPPSMAYSGPEGLLSAPEARQALLDSGKISKRLAASHELVFGLMARFFEQRACPEGIMAQNLVGLAKKLPTTQDHLSTTSKTSADWFKIKHTVDTPANQDAALAFIMDAAISFIALTHNHLWFEDISASGSLDFALRIFVNDLNVNEWHLREIKTIAGGEGRTYGESQLWDKNGRMVASMTQQSILRPKPTKKANL